MLCSPRLLSPEYPDHPHWLLASCPLAQSRQSENPTTSRPCSKSLHGSPWPQIKTHVGLAHEPPLPAQARASCSAAPFTTIAPHPHPGCWAAAGCTRLTPFPMHFSLPSLLFLLWEDSVIFLLQDPTQATLLQEPFLDPHPKSEVQLSGGLHHRRILHPLPLLKSHTHVHCHVTLLLFPLEQVEYISPPHMDVGLSHVTCYSQWHEAESTVSQLEPKPQQALRIFSQSFCHSP